MTLALENPVTMSGLYDSRFYEMTARANGETYRIFVGAPASMFVKSEAGHPARKSPAIYVLDGKLNFAMVHAQTQILSAMGQLPPAWVIGIAYAGDQSFFEKDVFLRHADLTPNAGGAFETEMLAMNGGPPIAAGGAPKFLAFLRDELKPALEATFAIDPNDATILGNSLGGLFPSWVLFHEPGVFQRYVIVSPSWWWNRYEFWQWEKRYAETHKDLHATVFATFGGLETAEKHKAIVERALADTDKQDVKRAIAKSITLAKTVGGWPDGAELALRFAKTMRRRNYRDCVCTVMNLPEETHESIPGPAFSRGLRYVFGSWTPPARGSLWHSLVSRPAGAN